MKRFLVVSLLALAALAAGCATTAEKDAAVKDAQAQQLMKADVLEAAKATVTASLFELTCPPNGCVIASLKVGNPAAAAQMADVMRVAFAPQPSVGLQAYIATMDMIGKVGVVGLVTHGVSSIMHSVTQGQVDTATAGFNGLSSTAASGFASNAAIASHIPQPGATTNISVTANGPGAAAASGGTATGNAPTTNTTTTTTTTNPAPTVVTCSGSPVVCTR